ncbi:hypothetical protein IW262DRAFT_1355985 [Armillaria fumosa]|nr:hypothetical protein IW262DRAFT_1355985 [Armillaria fumosa]
MLLSQLQSPSPLRKQKDQFHLAVPRWFVLQRFRTFPPKTKVERDKEYKCTSFDPEYVLYYELASGSLDARFIRTIYGLKNLYGHPSNASNVNKLEKACRSRRGNLSGH